MTASQAAGVAGGSTKHTQKQAEAHTPDHSNAFGAFTPEQVTRIVEMLEAQQDQEQCATAEFERAMDLSAAHNKVLAPAQLEALAKLREPFADDLISKRPQPWCKACNAASDRVCGKPHKKINCPTCKTWITEAHTDLDYVGHAGITDRLLSVDPTWDWEPLSTDANGLPLFDQHGGLWIKLIVCGMVRKGYGDAVGKKAGTTAVKEIIGDAIRNAAMRFGMALDLWSKADLHKESEPEPHPADQYVEAIKQQRVWTSERWLTGVRTEADEAGQLDHVVGSGGVTLGEIIDEQLGKLAESARVEAELRIEQEEKRRAATEQVAAEHGVRPQSGPPAQAAATPAPANAQGAPANSGPQSAEDIRAAWGDVWQDADALERLWEAARNIRVANAPASLSEPRAGTIGQALKTQINALRQGSSQGRATLGQPSGATHEYADQHGDWGYGDEPAG